MLLIILTIFNPLIIKWILNRKNAGSRLHKILKIYTKISERGRTKHLRSLIFIGKNMVLYLRIILPTPPCVNGQTPR